MEFSKNEFEKLKRYRTLFQCALLDIRTRMDILLEDFSKLQPYNPVEHIKYRLKTPESIGDKLHRLGYELTAENARNHLTDIAGLRCICSYTKDIAFMAAVIKRQPDIKILREKDYITSPKPSGYRSYHLILELPVYLSDGTERLPIEVQIRTQAMDFWAALEHKARYKFKSEIPAELAQELMDCAERIAELDDRMFRIQDRIDIEMR